MRRRRPERRTINPDPKFNDLQISKFMNYLLTDGKKGIAEKILYDAFDLVQEKSKKDPRWFRFCRMAVQRTNEKIFRWLENESCSFKNSYAGARCTFFR